MAVEQTASLKNIRIGDVLKESGYVNDEQIGQALRYQKEHKGMRLGGALIELGFISETNMLQALAIRLNMKHIDIANETVNLDATALIPANLAEKYCILAINDENGVLTVVVNDPMNFFAIEDIKQLTGRQLNICLCESAPLEKAISYYYSEVAAQKAARAANTMANEKKDDLEELTVEEGDDETPIINLLNSLLKRGYSVNCSDIHIEPFEDKSIVRMRIDGAIVDYVTLQKGLHASLIARIKIISDLDIAERRIPQDGHFRVNIEGQYVNVRVSILPTVFGEKAVMRLLAGNSTIQHADSFGMEESDYKRFRAMLDSPHGIIYLTGPTGSGKTTTLYMVLEEMAKRSVNISTIEDPVEKNLRKINQTQVNNTAGLTFEAGLRALLRQDPDIIMVGETRDSETASISVRSAITGHLVFSTLHTNDATSSIVRLIDMGVEPFLVANSMVGTVAQRLMRRICPECGQEVEATEEDCQLLRVTPGTKIKKAHGCTQCNYTGYSGRIAIHEILTIDSNVRKMITDGASMDEIESYAVKNQGMKLLRDSAREKVLQGITTVEELRRVAYYSDAPEREKSDVEEPQIEVIDTPVSYIQAAPGVSIAADPNATKAVVAATQRLEETLARQMSKLTESVTAVSDQVKNRTATAPALTTAATVGVADPIQVNEDPFANVGPATVHIEEIILKAREMKCSDIHITAAKPLMMRIHGALQETKEQYSKEEITAMLLEMCDSEQRAELAKGNDLDFAIQTRDGNRQRVNIFRDMGCLAATIRLLNSDIPTLESLGLPMVLGEIVKQPRGLILVTGPTGSGKSTTLAAMIDSINSTRPDHIITIEDPVEYVYEKKKGLVHQREVGRDVTSFAAALRSALREDPDIILVGEMRDYETISAALTAAETGHLVLSTLHTTGAAQTIDRIIDACPNGSQNQVRTQLAGVLNAVVTQCLVPKIEGGRIAATEILIGTDAISNMIRENKCHQMNTAMQGGAALGMHTLNTDLMSLVQRGIITMDQARRFTNDKRDLEQFM